jgi:hypothetical protein
MLGGQSRNRTTDTRIFKTNYYSVSWWESPRKVTKFLSADLFRDRNRTSSRTFVAYRSLTDVIVEQYQWIAMGFTDPLPILQWNRGLLLPYPAMPPRLGCWRRGWQLQTEKRYSIFKLGWLYLHLCCLSRDLRFKDRLQSTAATFGSQITKGNSITADFQPAVR